MDSNNLLNLSFEDLNINDELLRGIYSYGFEKPSNIQHKGIPIIQSGKDLIAQSQSGTGKTGSFTIGLLNKVDVKLKRTQFIIISPTHELANQIYDVFSNLSKYMEVSICKVIGKTNISQSREELSKDPQIIIATPGRLLDFINRQYIYTDQIKTLVIDEADEILSQGFMDSICNIIKCIPRTTQICLFSATIPNEILELTTNFMDNPEKLLVKADELTLEGIQQFYINLKQYRWKYDVLIDLYDTINVTQSIIYINSKHTLNNIYERLRIAEYPVSHIHGDMTKQDREQNLKDFKSGTTRVLLSTDLLSRGIDIQQLSLVINYDLPKSKETYIHRIGRSGRYGRKGVAINLVIEDDMRMLDEIQKFYNTDIKEMPQNISDFIS